MKKVILDLVLLIFILNIIFNYNNVFALENSQNSIDFYDLKRLLTAAIIPSQYDMRASNPYGLSNHGNVNINIEQQVGGTCWDFSAMMTVQTTIANKSNGTYEELSKAHLDYLASKYSGKSYGEKREIGTGGWFDTYAVDYFKNMDGPVLNSQCTYTLNNGKYDSINVTVNGTNYVNDTNEKKSSTAAIMDKINPSYYVHETIDFPQTKKERQNDGTVKIYDSITKETISETELNNRRNQVKQHIINYGGVTATIRTHKYFIGNNLGSPYNTYEGRFSQYDDGSIQGEVDGESTALHAITIIGWDDNYDKNKIYAKNSKGEITHPTSNGAYLIANSYGSSAFEKGYQWMSYEDYYIEDNMHAILSVNTNPSFVTYTFEGQEVYNKMKEILDRQGYFEADDNTKTIRVLDIVINELKELDLRWCNLGDSDLQMILSKSSYPKLTKLLLSGQNNTTRITNISGIKKLTKLEVLAIDYNNIVDISDLEKLKELKTLYINNNSITDISALRKLSKLRYLNASNNKIKDTSVLNLEQFDYVNLSNQTIEDYKKGDIDGNGTINLIDVLKLRRYLANQKKEQKIDSWELSEEEQTRADASQNGKIDLMDVLVLRRYIAASKSETVKKNHPDWYWEN